MNNLNSVHRQIFITCALGLSLGSATAAEAPPPQVLEAVTVTATRVATDPFNVPASISVVPGEAFNKNTLGVNLSEGLHAVPGLLDRNRQDYAQEEQLSIRGFGANSTFGVLGVRLYIDGIPATQPDGQGAATSFNLASADRVEVLRGPFSALYGNSAGGVVEIYTADGSGPLLLSGGTAGGSYGTYRADLGASGSSGIAEYNVHFTHFSTDGYREHSRAQRESFNGKVSLKLGEHSRLSLLSNVMSAPGVQDPMALKSAMLDADPRQVDPGAETYNTRKSAQQAQFGAVYEYLPSDSQSFRMLTYYGQRQITQFLSIPRASQTPPASPGGAINLINIYGGADARWTYRTHFLDRPLSVVAGLSFDDMREHRRGYNNFVGAGICGSPGSLCGVQGDLRRDEINTIYNVDQYAEVNMAFNQQWSMSAGLRRSQVNFNSGDMFPVDANHPDTSGNKTYVSTSPVVGLMFKAKSWMHWYASYGAGFQTPTFAQLAYRPDGSAGLNFGLQAARSNNAELGTKLRLGAHTKTEIAVFNTSTINELVIDTNANGRSTYQNVGRTWRRGIEAGLETELVQNLQFQLTYTYLYATVREPYLTCAAPGCGTPTVLVAAGNRLPGVPQSNAYAALRWGGETGWHASLNGQYLSAVPVNDSNTVFAPAYSLLGLDTGYVLDHAHWRIRPFVRVDNILDRHYVSAISVNDGNERFFYPGTDRSALAGCSFDWK